jgi:choice-of-anchor A domain-containing protein
MKSSIAAVCLLCGCLAQSLYASAGAAEPSAVFNPFAYFNVYSLNDIGSASSAYQSDIQGTCGAGGSVYFSNFSLDGIASQWGYVLHTGGNATLTGSYRGSLDIDGSVRAGGNVSHFSGGTIYGDVSAAGSAIFNPSLTVWGTVTERSAYQPLVNHSVLSDYFMSQSANIASMSATGSYVNNYGGLVINAGSGINVIDIGASVLQSAWGVTVNAPSDAIVYFNVSGLDARLNWLTWQYTGGITADDVLLNFTEATSLILNGGGVMNVLAPLADTTFAQGQLTGNLVVGNLSGGGEVHAGGFGHGADIPEPATLMILCLGGLFMRRVKSGKSPV